MQQQSAFSDVVWGGGLATRSSQMTLGRACSFSVRYVKQYTSNKQVIPKSFGKSASLPLMAEIGLDLPISCAIPTADESNHSATGMLHQHGNAMCVLYVTLH